jgi:acetyl esterase/lipase
MHEASLLPTAQRLFAFLLIAALAICVLAAPSQADPSARAAAIPLWPAGSVPGALGTRPQDTPTITPYLLPDKTPGAAPRPALVICPGGGYGGLADYEGHDYALFLNQHGIVCFVLTYRLGTNGYHHPSMLADAARALRTVRARANEWGVDPNRVGIMGSSAGGHLAATLLTHFDAGKPDATDPIERQSSRPSVGVLCYAVISMENGLTHAGSRHNLLGDSPAQSLVDDLSNEKKVTPQTPPCFIWHTAADATVKVANSLAFAAALDANHVPFDLHVYQNGAHGLALGDKPPFTHVHPWAGDLLYWLRAQGWKTEPVPAATP